MLALSYGLALVVLTGFGLHLLVLAVAAASRDRLLPGAVPHHNEPPALHSTGGGVTVQIPLYNEKFVARRVIDACARLHFPSDRLEIQVLDDSTDETSSVVAERCAHWRSRGIDIRHVRRPARSGFKAGALQAGLRSARGEFIAVFDADFSPAPDFLLRLLPRFSSGRVGMVQAPWGHLNGETSLLTRTQAVGLDSHFAVEQRGRSALGCYFNFNGTAGIWRRACIEDAGGWSSDTLTEDLDLSYRAQMRGWRFALQDETEVCAELPEDLNALRGQQFRWTKGAVETARKNLGPLWRSSAPWWTKTAGTLHLLGNLSYLFLFCAALLHAPLIGSAFGANGPGRPYFALLSVGLLGLAGMALSHTIAARRLYPDWPRRLLRLPWFIAGTIGLSFSNTLAVIQALAGIRTPFLRTPKSSGARTGFAAEYLAHRPAMVSAVEIAVGTYCALGAAYLLYLGAVVALPFQIAFAAGFLLVGFSGLNRGRERAARGAAAHPTGEETTTELKSVP